MRSRRPHGQAGANSIFSAAASRTSMIGAPKTAGISGAASAVSTMRNLLMGFDAESIPSDLRFRIDGSLARCMAGEISPPVALMQLLSALSDRDDGMELIVRCIDHLSTRRMPAARAR